MKKFLWALLPMAILASCGKTNERKVMIVANGDITVGGSDITISNPSDGAVEKIVDIKDAGQHNFSIDNNGTKSTVDIDPGTGYYILNLMKDTVYGSQLVDGRDYNTDHEMELDEQKATIDSLNLVLAGKNISAANKNFLIVPGQLTKITDDLVHAHVFGPFHAMDSNIDAPADGKAPVLYKFYSKDELQTRLKTIEESYNATN